MNDPITDGLIVFGLIIVAAVIVILLAVTAFNAYRDGQDAPETQDDTYLPGVKNMGRKKE